MVAVVVVFVVVVVVVEEKWTRTTLARVAEFEFRILLAQQFYTRVWQRVNFNIFAAFHSLLFQSQILCL